MSMYEGLFVSSFIQFSPKGQDQVNERCLKDDEISDILLYNNSFFW